MKKLFIGLGILAIVLSTTMNVSAELMRGTWTADISTVNGELAESIWSVGDQWTIELLYDDADEYAYEYYDGPNGIAEFGGGDDELWGSWSLASGDLSVSASFTLDSQTSLYRSLMPDIPGRNLVKLVENHPSYPGYYLQMYWDGIEINIFEDDTQYSMIGATDAWPLNANDIFFENAIFTSVPAASVPVPPSLLLLGSGITGLIGTRLRKKNK